MPFDADCNENLVRIAKAYAKAEGITLSTVGRRCYGNVNFFKFLKRGAVRLNKIEEVLRWFKENWPENASWPHVSPIWMTGSDKK